MKPFYCGQSQAEPLSPCFAASFYDTTTREAKASSKQEKRETDGRLPPPSRSSAGGLWACGCDASGVMYSEKRPYVTYGGAAIGFAYTSGRLAGGYAVDYAADVQ